jgi:carboxyl-terminal processing protease
LKITRETIKSPSVTVKNQNGVAIITISRFGDDTVSELDKQIPAIVASQPKGIVLDLRDNPGGFLDGAVSVTSRFQKEGLVVKEQLRNSTEEQKVDGNAPLADIPLVILVNKGSASAAEITAGALRDNRHVPLVGEQTFGKGSVQELEELNGGAVLKLTIAEWLTPSGISISKEGLKPDVVVSSENPDAQLQAAIAKLAG